MYFNIYIITYFLKIFSIVFPLASSSTSLSKYLIFLHQWVFNFFYPATTNHSLDKSTIRIHLWCFIKESGKINFLIQLFLQSFFIISRQPTIISSTSCLIRFFFSTFATNNGQTLETFIVNTLFFSITNQCL